MWKIGLAVVLLVAAFAGGYYKGSGQVVTQIVKEQGETKTIVQDHIVTRIITRNPDGTTTETTKDETIAKQEDTHTSKTDTESSPTQAPGSNYSLGLHYWAGSTIDYIRPGNPIAKVGISAGYRVLGPIWLDGEVRPFGSRKEVALGFSIQF